MEKISSSAIIISVLASIVAALVAGIILENYETVPQADFAINIQSGQKTNSTSFAYITIENTGQIAAREVTIIINPENDMIEFSRGLQMEQFEMNSHGPRSLFVEMPRLANGAMIGVNTILNVTNDDRGRIHIFVASDQGSKIYHEPNDFGVCKECVIISVTMGIIVGLLSIITQSKFWKK